MWIWAHEEVTACLEALYAETLRTMTPGTVVTLVSLSRSLNIAFSEKSLETLAMELIPPGIRTGLIGR